MQFQPFLLVFQVILAVSLISLILLQHGRGAQAGAAFGSGASATVFGSRGSASFLTKLTTVLAIIFFANSLGLAYLSAQQPTQSSLVDQIQVETPDETADESGNPAVTPLDKSGTSQGDVGVAADEAEPAASTSDAEAGSSEPDQPAGSVAETVEKQSEQPADVPPVE